MRKWAFEITENMKTFAKVNRAVDTLIMKGAEMTTGMKLMQTKSGKIHLLSAGGTRAVCTVNKKTGISKRVINMESEITPEDALKADPKNFCKKCLGQQPYVFIQQIIDENSPRHEPEPTPDPEPILSPTTKPKLSPINGNGMTQIDALNAMIDRLDEFAEDKANSLYKRSKASFYAEALKAVNDMVQTGKAESMNRIADVFNS